MWIGFVGKLEEYPIKSHERLRDFYARTLSQIPQVVWDDHLVRMDFSAGASMRSADGSYANPHYPEFVGRYAGIYEKLGVHPKRCAHITFSDESRRPAGADDCRTTGPSEWECFVIRSAAMSSSWFSYVEDHVTRGGAGLCSTSGRVEASQTATALSEPAKETPPAHPSKYRFIVDASMRRPNGSLFNPYVEDFVREFSSATGSPVRLVDFGPGILGECYPGAGEIVCRIGQGSGMGKWVFEELARVAR
jgi:hypothetical protein